MVNISSIFTSQCILFSICSNMYHLQQIAVQTFNHYKKYYQSNIDNNITVIIDNQNLATRKWQHSFYESTTAQHNFSKTYLSFKNLQSKYYYDYPVLHKIQSNRKYININHNTKIIQHVLDQNCSNYIKHYRYSQLLSTIQDERLNPNDKLHNFTEKHLDKKLVEYLLKGTNFIPCPSKQCNFNVVRSNVIKSLKNLIHKEAIDQGFWLDINNYSIIDLCSLPFISNHCRNYLINTIEFMQQCLYEDDIRFIHNKPNISQHSLKLLYNAAKSNHIVFNIADKNLWLCINDTTWYMDEYSRHLSDTHTYQELDYNLLSHILDTSISQLHGLYYKYLRNPPKHVNNKDIKSFYKRKTHLDIKLPSLNLVPKPHKLKQKASSSIQHLLKSRPIVNGFNTVITEPSKVLSKLVRYFLKKLRLKFKHCDTLVNSSLQVVNQLKTISIDPYDMELHFISFDFSSLYTSIDNYTVISAFLFLQTQLHIEQATIQFMIELFYFIKNNAYFHVGFKRLFLQKQGLAMGSYDSADIANLALFISEIHLFSFSNVSRKILYMARYIDDGTIVLKTTSNQLMLNLHEIKQCYPKELEITFSVNKIHTQFLDITYGIGYTTFINKIVYTSIYQKPYNAYSYIHFNSGHPKHFFKGVITTECHRYRTRSSNAMEYNTMCKLFAIRLQRCGYPKKYIKRHLLSYNFTSNDNFYKKPTLGTCKFCNIKYQKTTQEHKLVRYILTKSPPFCYKWVFSYSVGTKLKQILLTKRRLHLKLGNYL